MEENTDANNYVRMTQIKGQCATVEVRHLAPPVGFLLKFGKEFQVELGPTAQSDN